jgi:hypothetical protein
MSLLVVFGLFALLAVAASLFGAESREGFVSDARPRRWFIRL